MELLLIYRPRRDGRLSWPSWLTHSGHFTHEVVTRQPWIRRRSGKVRQLQTNVLTVTTEPRRQLSHKHRASFPNKMDAKTQRTLCTRCIPGGSNTCNSSLCFRENYCNTQLWTRAAHLLQADSAFHPLRNGKRVSILWLSTNTNGNERMFGP